MEVLLKLNQNVVILAYVLQIIAIVFEQFHDSSDSLEFIWGINVTFFLTVCLLVKIFSILVIVQNMWNAFFIFCALEQLIFIYLVANCFPILSLNHPFQFHWILTSQAAIVFLDLTLFITLLWIHCHSSSNEWKKWSEMQKKNEKPEKLIMTTHGNTEHYGECNEENVALIHRESDSSLESSLSNSSELVPQNPRIKLTFAEIDNEESNGTEQKKKKKDQSQTPLLTEASIDDKLDNCPKVGNNQSNGYDSSPSVVIPMENSKLPHNQKLYPGLSSITEIQKQAYDQTQPENEQIQFANGSVDSMGVGGNIKTSETDEKIDPETQSWFNSATSIDEESSIISPEKPAVEINPICKLGFNRTTMLQEKFLLGNSNNDNKLSIAPPDPISIEATKNEETKKELKQGGSESTLPTDDLLAQNDCMSTDLEMDESKANESKANDVSQALATEKMKHGSNFLADDGAPLSGQSETTHSANDISESNSESSNSSNPNLVVDLPTQGEAEKINYKKAETVVIKGKAKERENEHFCSENNVSTKENSELQTNANFDEIEGNKGKTDNNTNVATLETAVVHKLKNVNQNNNFVKGRVYEIEKQARNNSKGTNA